MLYRLALGIILFTGLLSLPAAALSPTAPTINLPHPSASAPTIQFSSYKVTNGATNSDWQTMILALAACQSAHAAVLNIPQGTYYFNDPGVLTRNGGGHIQLSGMTDFTINGNGSTFIFHYPRNGMDFYGCQRVQIKNLTVQWDFDIAAPGTVQMVNGQKAIVVNSAYPITSSTPVQAITEYDTANMAWKMDAQEVYWPASVQLVAPQTLASPSFAMFPVGDTVAVREYVYAARAFEFSFNSNADLTFTNITAENCPGMVFVGYGADRGFSFQNCVIQRRNPAHDLVSTGADGIHIGMSHGDCSIQNCNFTYLGDDSVNIHSIWMFVVSRLGNNSATLSTIVYDPTYVQVGDQLEFLNASNLQPVSTAHVTAVSYNAATEIYTMTFRETLPASLPAGVVVANLARSSSRYNVSGNNFHDNRGRGILAQAPQGLIQNNTIRNVMGGAINLTADHADWNEGYGCNTVVVNKNLCDGCNYGYWGGFADEPGVCLGVINVFAQSPTGVDDFYVHQHIQISNNVINNTPNISFFISSVQGLQVTGNSVTNCPASSTRAFFITRASQVTVTGNQAVNCSIPSGAGIYIEPGSSEQVTISNNSGF